MGMKDRWKGKEPQEAKRKERSMGKRKGEGGLGIEECVIENHIDLRH